MPTTDEITGTIIDAAMQIHRDLGPGLLESAYEELLAGELLRRGLRVERQLLVSFTYKGQVIRYGFRLDMLVESAVLVELKSTERPAPINARQLLTYLRLMDRRVGLVINFGMYRLVDGVQRITNGFARPND